MGLVLLKTTTTTSYNRAMNLDYVYEVKTYRDEETGKRVTKRRVIGKKDRVTGKTVPTNRHLSPSPEAVDNLNYKELYDKTLNDLQEQSKLDQQLKSELIDSLTRSSEKMRAIIGEVQNEVDQINQLIKLVEAK